MEERMDEAYAVRDQLEPPSTSYAPGGTPLDLGGSDFQLLNRALLNERSAPELLDYKDDLVARVRAGLSRQDAELAGAEGARELELVRAVLALERDRARYLLKAYLRTRLAKIQAHAGAILESEMLTERLSSGELTFARGVFVALGRHLRSSALCQMPPQYTSLVKCFEGEAANSMLDRPDASRYVFAHVLDDCGQVPDGPDGQTAELRRGDVMVVRYSTVAHLVGSGQVCLL